MAEEKLLTVRDVSIILGISEKEVVDKAESGEIPAYKIAGVYLRFKKEQIQALKKTSKPSSSKGHIDHQYSLRGRIGDFLYFNDFYIFALVIIALLLFIILRGYSL